MHSLGPQQGVARCVEEVALPPLTPPPLPCHRYRRRTSSCTRVWRPAPPQEHPFLSPGGFRGASCSVCRVCGYGAFLALCWSVCACSLIPAGNPWVNRCVLAERSTHTPHPHHTTSTHHTQPSPPISLHYHSFLSTQVWDGVQFTVCLGCTLCLLIKFDLFD